MSTEDEAIPENLIYSALGYRSFDNKDPVPSLKDNEEIIESLIKLGIPDDIVIYLCTKTNINFEQLGRMIDDITKERNDEIS